MGNSVSGKDAVIPIGNIPDTINPHPNSVPSSSHDPRKDQKSESPPVVNVEIGSRETEDDIDKNTKIKRMRQAGVSAEKINKGDDMAVITIPKSEEAKIQIAQALKTNALFLNMDDKQMEAVIAAMERTVVPNGNYACKHGQTALHFYTIESGVLNVTIPVIGKDGIERMKFVRKMSPGQAFGETFLFNVKRTASCQAEDGEVVIWGISRDNFRKVLKRLVTTEHRKMIKFLDSNLSFMKELKDDDLHALLKAIETIKYPKGTRIIEEGKMSNGLYIVYQGEVSVWMPNRVNKRTAASVARTIDDEIDEDDDAIPSEIGLLEGGIEAPSSVGDCGGELVLKMTGMMKESNAKERKSMKKMSVIATRRMQQSDVTLSEVKRIKVSGFFGERSMLVDEPAIATVIAEEETVLLKIDKFFFMRYLSPIESISERCRTEYGVLVLKSVPVLRDMTLQQRNMIKPLLTTRWYSPGEVLIKQGDISRTFFIIASGEVKIEQTLKMKYDESFTPATGKVVRITEYDEGEEKMMEVLIELGKMYQGQYFGEKGLNIGSVQRESTIVAETEVYVFCLSRESFQTLLAVRGEEQIQSLQPSYSGAAKLVHSDVHENQQTHITTEGELSGATIDDFLAAPEILGAGAFGEVRMVKYKKNNKYYASKIVQKKNMESSGNPLLHADLILHEITVMAEMTPSPFILSLHNAFKDKKAMYIITDLVDGQELYQMIQEKGEKFDTATQKFITANVILMLEHLLKENVVYRDLKPENLIVDHDGYLKMIDFGFARRIKSRTWTFCGSPDYIAPEVLTCVGHDCMADWWSLGVLLFEIVSGGTPFHDDNHDNPYQTYSNIIMGNIVGSTKSKIEPQSEVMDLINNLLKRDKTLRLPYFGSENVRFHPWFKGFNWEECRSKTMKPPFTTGHQMTIKMKTKYKDADWIPLKLPLHELDDEDTIDWFDTIEWKFHF